MTRGQRRLGFILAALAIAAGAYGLWWERAADAAKQNLENWIEALREGGVDFRHDGIETAGFPFVIRLIVSNPAIDAGFGWRGPERISAQISPLDPTRLSLSAPGRHAFAAFGKTLDVELGKAMLAVDAGAGGIDALSLDLGKAAILGDWGGPLGVEALSLAMARRLDIPEDDLSTPTVSLSVIADGVTLPSGLKPPLGANLSKLVLKLSLKGPAPRSLSREQLSYWSQAGGVLETEYVYLDYPPLRLEGDGTLALDRDLLPLAPFGLKASGLLEAVDGLAANGWIKADQALPVKLAVAELAKAPPDPRTGGVILPLTLQGQGIYLGATKIADLPKLPWIKD